MLMYEDLRTLYAVTAKERDELKRENEYLRKIVEKQARMNRAAVAMALELDKVTAERDALVDEIRGCCNMCTHWLKGVGDKSCHDCGLGDNWEWRGREGK